MNNEVILMVPESNDFSRKQLEELEGGKILQTGLEGQERFGLIGDIAGRHCREVRKAKVVCEWFPADERAWRKSRVWEETGRRRFPAISGGRNGCDRWSWVCLETLYLQRLPHSLRWRTHAFGCEEPAGWLKQEGNLSGGHTTGHFCFCLCVPPILLRKFPKQPPCF